jgi:predicted RNase H-like HicB family nuclease
MKKYLIVIEKTSTGFSAYSPDLDGCVLTGATREEVERNMREEGQAVPEPHSYSAYVELPA